ncbi:MAG: ATP-binding protein [Deltaproteobacteria bacterium]|nr:ATP-binding protein [Deltaproteobacteria bacterium]
MQQLLDRRQSFLLFGPRQTGKSTLLEALFAQLPAAQCLTYYFQLPSQREAIEQDPECIVREVEAKRSRTPLFLYIDEIQKIPAVMDPLQFLLDHRRIVLAATGSSARKMKRLRTNWLPGRVQLHFLPPLTWQETGFPLSRLGEILRYGMLPGILSQTDFTQREGNLNAYTHLYLEEEIRAEAAVRNVPRFTQFLRLAALESGGAPNFSKIGGRIGLSHTTIREYFQILEDSLIIQRLPAFGQVRDAVFRTAKYYFFDLGVRNAAAQIGHGPGLLPLQQGVLFEHLMVLELMARRSPRTQLFYWRHKQGDEVDMVLETGQQRIAIEVKATARPTLADTKGLAHFCKEYRPHAAYLVCQVARAQRIGQILAIPWAELFQYLE